MKYLAAFPVAILGLLLTSSAQAAVMAGYSGVVLDDSPLGYWRLDEPYGAAEAVDSSGNNRNLTLTGFDAGQVQQTGATADGNTALYFRDAKTATYREDTAVSPNTTDFSFAAGESFSFEYWVKVAPGHGSSGETGLLSNNYAESQNTPWYMSRLTGSGDNRKPDFYLRTAASNNASVTASTNVVDDQWHHVVGVYDASGAGEMKIYVDSVLEATTSSVTAAAYGTNGAPLILGNHSNRLVVATLDEVAMYAAPLSETDIISHFQSAQDKLLVDFGNSLGSGNGPGGRQEGFFEFEAAEGGGNPAVTIAYDSGLGAAGTVDVTIGGYTHFRDYNAVSSGPFAGLSGLLSDSVLRNSNGTMTLTLDDLADGIYIITTYHHGTENAPGTILSTVLTDGVLTDEVISTNFLGSSGTGPSAVATQMFHFTVVDGSPVVIEFTGGATNNHIQLNGFQLEYVPEPTSLALLIGLGVAGLAARLRRRRR